MTLRWYESAFLRPFKLCLTLLNHPALQRGHKHVRIFSILQHEMPLISWIKGDHLIIPSALDQGGRSRAQAHVVLSWWKEVDGRDPSPLPAVCPRLLHAGAPLGDSAEPPRSKSQYWNNHKDNTYPWNRHVSSHPGLCSQLPTSLGVEGGVWTCFSDSCHIYTNKRPSSLFFEFKFRRVPPPQQPLQLPFCRWDSVLCSISTKQPKTFLSGKSTFKL